MLLLNKGMEKRLVLIVTYFAIFSVVIARPFPQLEDNGGELLGVRDTRYYGVPFFWFGRPFYEDDGDDYTGNGGQDLVLNKRSSTVSYANVGAGWGR